LKTYVLLNLGIITKVNILIIFGPYLVYLVNYKYKFLDTGFFYGVEQTVKYIVLECPQIKLKSGIESNHKCNVKAINWIRELTVLLYTICNLLHLTAYPLFYFNLLLLLRFLLIYVHFYRNYII